MISGQIIEALNIPSKVFVCDVKGSGEPLLFCFSFKEIKSILYLKSNNGHYRK